MTDSEKLERILSDMQDMKSDMQDMKSDMQGMKEGLQEVKERVTRTELTIENEIRVNIQRVAEGHLDLSRNLQNAMTPNNEVEMLAIRVGMLESDVRKLKAKFA